MTDAAGSANRIIFFFTTGDFRLTLGGPSVSTQNPSSTSTWYLLVATYAGGGASPRFHVHDGTSWNHAVTASPGAADIAAILAGDRLRVGISGSGSQPLSGDVVCCGIKKSNSSDATVETLTRTAFSDWQAFGFDWLIGFDSSKEAAGILQDQASPGTGDETAISGTSQVSDPAGWSWAGAAAPTILGYNTKGVGGTTTGAGRRYVTKLTHAAAATMTELHAFAGGTTPTGMQIVIYADSAGLPGARVAYTAPITPPSGAGSDVSQAGFGVALAAGDYWIGFVLDSTGGTTMYYDDPGTNVHQANTSGAAYNPPSNPFGSPNSSGTRKYSCWAVVGSGAPTSGFLGFM
jgi:hypothetical protein